MTVESVLSSAVANGEITVEEYQLARTKLMAQDEPEAFSIAKDNFKRALEYFDTVNLVEVRGLIVEDENRRSLVYAINNATHRRMNVLRILDETYQEQDARLHNFIKPSQAYLFEVRP